MRPFELSGARIPRRGCVYLDVVQCIKALRPEPFVEEEIPIVVQDGPVGDGSVTIFDPSPFEYYSPALVHVDQLVHPEPELAELLQLASFDEIIRRRDAPRVYEGEYAE